MASPGSGKSSLAGRLGDVVINTDAIRKFVCGDECILTEDALVFRIARLMVEHHLARGRSVVYDATNISRSARKPLISLARRRGAKVRVVWVNVPLPTALDRNRGRARRVPEAVIARMARRLEPPSLAEGVDVVEERGEAMSLGLSLEDPRVDTGSRPVL